MSEQAKLWPHERTLLEAREDVMAKRWGEGIQCPCCDQLARVYRRPLNGSQVRWLMMLAALSIDGLRKCAFKAPEVLAQSAAAIQLAAEGWVTKERWTERPEGGDYGKLTYWGLAEVLSGLAEGAPEVPRFYTGGRSGVWRPTRRGLDFCYGRAPVPAWVLVYNGELAGSDPEAPMVYARDVAGKVFNYDELLAAMPRERGGRDGETAPPEPPDNRVEVDPPWFGIFKRKPRQVQVVGIDTTNTLLLAINLTLGRIAAALEEPINQRLEAEAARLKSGLDAIEKIAGDATPAPAKPRRK